MMEKTKSPGLGTTQWVRVAAERGWTEGSSQEVYLRTLVADREDARHSLRSKVGNLRASLDRLDKILRVESPVLNTLGELQGQPSAVEAAVGAFDAADRALHAYLKLFPPTAS